MKTLEQIVLEFADFGIERRYAFVIGSDIAVLIKQAAADERDAIVAKINNMLGFYRPGSLVSIALHQVLAAIRARGEPESGEAKT